MSTSCNLDLLKAFEQRNLGKFQESLEVFQADPNYLVKAEDKTIFEIILGTPGSSRYIKLCIENDADFYMVVVLWLTFSFIYSTSYCLADE